jgi:uncharacterized protein
MPLEKLTSTHFGNDSHAYLVALKARRNPTWKNEVTMRSFERYAAYDPGIFIDRISPRPLLVIAATRDAVTPTDEILTSYNQALEPKKLVLIEGGHFDPYTTKFDKASAAAADWFEQHL